MVPSQASQVDDGWSLASSRSRRQFGLFLAGSTFVLLATAITRRAVVRRYHLTRPTFFHPSNMPPLIQINGQLEALDALGIATINVFSYGIAFGGGALWASNISTVAELKSRIKMPLDLETSKELEQKPDDGLIESWPAAALALQEEERLESQAAKDKASKREGPR